MENILEGIFAIVAGTGMIALFYSGVIWFAKKFLGTQVVSKTQLGSAIQRNSLEQHFLGMTESELLQEAIRRCESKGYAKTTSNISDEIFNIQVERGVFPKEKSLVSEQFNKIASNAVTLINSLRPDKISKLEKLVVLKEKGALTNDEFEIEKKKLLND